VLISAKNYYFGRTFELSASRNDIYNLTGPIYEGKVLSPETDTSKFNGFLS